MSIALAVFAIVLGTILGAYWFFVARVEQRSERDLLRRLRVPRTSKLEKTDLAKARERLSSVGSLDRLLTRWSRYTTPVSAWVSGAGMRMTVGRLLLTSLFVAVATIAVVNRLTTFPLAALVAGAIAGAVPLLYVRWMAAKRLRVFEEQFPEAIDMIARALRAGHALPTALQMVAEEIRDPIGGEFKQLFDQQNYGLSLPESLRSFAERVPLLDARFFVTAVLTQRETGGNLSEVLDKLSAVIRERFKVKRQVRVVSAHGRITGMVLGMLPLAVGGLLAIVSPDHMRLLIDDPIGIGMLCGALVLQVIGVFIIRRIVNVEY
jgi:tight adherence protein B